MQRGLFTFPNSENSTTSGKKEKLRTILAFTLFDITLLICVDTILGIYHIYIYVHTHSPLHVFLLSVYPNPIAMDFANAYFNTSLHIFNIQLSPLIYIAPC